MREPSVIVKRDPRVSLILDLKSKVSDRKQRMQMLAVEIQSLERDLYLLEKSVNVQAGSSDT